MGQGHTIWSVFRNWIDFIMSSAGSTVLQAFFFCFNQLRNCQNTVKEIFDRQSDSCVLTQPTCRPWRRLKQSGAATNFDDCTHCQIWEPNINNDIYILDIHQLDLNSDSFLRSSNLEVEIPPFWCQNLAIKKTVRKLPLWKKKPPSVFLCRKVFYA